MTKSTGRADTAGFDKGLHIEGGVDTLSRCDLYRSQEIEQILLFFLLDKVEDKTCF
jgi:hypothetical protein